MFSAHGQQSLVTLLCNRFNSSFNISSFEDSSTNDDSRLFGVGDDNVEHQDGRQGTASACADALAMARSWPSSRRTCMSCELFFPVQPVSCVYVSAPACSLLSVYGRFDLLSSLLKQDISFHGEENKIDHGCIIFSAMLSHKIGSRRFQCDGITYIVYFVFRMAASV